MQNCNHEKQRKTKISNHYIIKTKSNCLHLSQTNEANNNAVFVMSLDQVRYLYDFESRGILALT